MKRMIILVLLVVALMPIHKARANDLGKILQVVAQGAAVAEALKGPSDSEIEKMALQAEQGLIGQYGTTEKGRARVQGIVNKMAKPDEDLAVKVLVSKDKNAMALPGGRLFITDSFLAGLNDKQIAGVMGHELAHVRKGHTKSRLKKLYTAQGIGGALEYSKTKKGVQQGFTVAALLSLLSYSREQEYEADKFGARYAAEANFGSQGLSEALMKLDGGKNVEFLSSHPETSKRIERLAKEEQGSYVETPQGKKRDPLTVQRIEIDGVELEGSYGYEMKNEVASMIRIRAKKMGIEVAVSGENFRTVAETQDRTHDSGRYSTESKSQVPRGRMVAPTLHLFVTGKVNVEDKPFSANMSVRGNNVSVRKTKVIAISHLKFEPVGISSGLSELGGETEAKESAEVNFDVSAGGGGQYGNTSRANYDVRSELVRKATSRAVDQFMATFSPEPLWNEPKAVVSEKNGKFYLWPEDGRSIEMEITSTKGLHIHDIIIYYRQDRNNERVIARYKVLTINGQNIAVETLFELSRPGRGEEFDIVQAR